MESTEGPRCMAAAQVSFYSHGKIRLFVLLACCSPPSVSPSLLSSVILSFWNGYQQMGFGEQFDNLYRS